MTQDSRGSERGPRAVVLLSGGLDSGVALARHLDRGGSVDTCLFLDYGQPAAPAEQRASAALAERFGVDWQAIALPWLGGFSAVGGSGLAPGGTPPELDPDGEAPLGDDASARAVWVPARNLVFVAIAASRAEASGAEAVVVGFNREEAATFPDNRPEFVDALDRVLDLGLIGACRVLAPVQDLDKPGLASAALGFGLGPQDFWSCYLPDSDRATCRCESCVRSRRAWSV